MDQFERLSTGTLFRAFWGKILLTWGWTVVETAMLAALPLLIGWSIDGLLAGDWAPFRQFVAVLGVLLLVAVTRRIYDTRAYGTMRVELGAALANRSVKEPVSVLNARLGMSRELVDFLEVEVPQLMTALVQILASVIILFTFHSYLAFSAAGAAVSIVLVYLLFNRRFFRLNGALNEQVESQVHVLESRSRDGIGRHLFQLRKHEVKLSDTESLVYGLIFLILFSMLAFNLWFAATESEATPGQIFSIVSYSYEFVQSSVILPMALQSLTRLSEITTRINRKDESSNDTGEDEG